MSKFNGTAPKKTPRAGQTVVNHQGGVGVTRSAKAELANLAVTTMLTDSFYEKSDVTVERMFNLVKEIKDPVFIEKLAVVVRRDFGMRTSSTALLAMLTLTGRHASRDGALGVMVRPDDIGNFLAANRALSSKGKFTTIAKEASAMAFSRLTERGALRYLGSNKVVSLAKALSISHPKPVSDAQSALFNFIKNHRLGGSNMQAAWDALPEAQRALLPLVGAAVRGEDTDGQVSYQRTRSAALKNQEGKSAVEIEKLKADTWVDTLDAMGTMALVRNIVNIIEQVPGTGYDSFWNRLHAKLSNPEEVHRSGMFPYQIFLGYMALRYETIDRGYGGSGFGKERNLKHRKLSLVYDGLNNAIIASAGNVELSGKTLIAGDTSGSMTGSRVAFSNAGKTDTSSAMSPALLSGVMGIALSYANPEADFVTFDTSARMYKYRAELSMLENMVKYAKEVNGGGTYFNEINKVVDVSKYDRVIIFTDAQFGDNPASTLKRVKGNIYLFNLVSYHAGASKKAENYYEFGGFSSTALNLIRVHEIKDIVSYVESYDIRQTREETTE